MIEYPAMIYRNGRCKTYVASCFIKNLVGFGKTEEDALNNLKESLQNVTENADICVKPIYNVLMAQ